MLKRWSVGNFKSFYERTDIELAPITVLAGANSSGKSTIIQSILLLKQTIQYVPASRAIGLNGPLLKLGFFSDIKCVGSADPDIELSWEITDLTGYRTSIGPQSGPLIYGLHPRSITSASFDIKFGIAEEGSAGPEAESGSELKDLQPVLRRVVTSVKYTDFEEPDQEATAKIDLVRRPIAQKDPTTMEGVKDRSLPFEVKYTDDNTRRQLLQKRTDSKLVGATTRHFFPLQVGVSFNRRKDNAKKVAAGIATPHDPLQYYYEAETRAASISEELVNNVVGVIRDAIDGATTSPTFNVERARERIDRFAKSESSVAEFFGQLQNFLRSVDPRLRSTVRSALAEHQAEFERIVLDTTSSMPESGFEFLFPSFLSQCVELTSLFFQHSIRYLGPLRDEPRPIYPLEALVNPTDVGYKGEHTAAVLDLHRDRLVEYLPSSSVDSIFLGQQRATSLHSAVVDWLSYLGVAEGVSTADLGKMGHQLQVRTGDISKDHDLTNVGVGVSQLLPIIVMALLSPSPCLLIFEQPELHLHPKVQARLADFFLSLGFTGRQCILETHSEYLVERLRRRIAESEGDLVSSKIRIYFTEKSSGRTVCTPVELTEYGAIKNWPSDFFDQGPAETEQILRAAQEKLSRERQRAANAGLPR